MIVGGKTKHMKHHIQAISTKLAGNIPCRPLTFPDHLLRQGQKWENCGGIDIYQSSVLSLFFVTVITSPFRNDKSPLLKPVKYEIGIRINTANHEPPQH